VCSSDLGTTSEVGAPAAAQPGPITEETSAVVGDDQEDSKTEIPPNPVLADSMDVDTPQKNPTLPEHVQVEAVPSSMDVDAPQKNPSLPETMIKWTE
jgi:hypothetical protein